MIYLRLLLLGTVSNYGTLELTGNLLTTAQLYLNTIMYIFLSHDKTLKNKNVWGVYLIH